MSLVEWNEEIKVDVPLFDEQHKRLVALLNELHGHMRAGKGREVIGKTLDELLAYTDYHFSAERRAFEAHDYPHCAHHLAEHQKLMDTARELKARHDAGNLAITVEVLDFLKKWVTEHIKKCDKLYTEFFRNRPVQDAVAPAGE